MSDPDRLPVPDFRTVFERAPILHMLLTPDLIVVAVSDRHLEATLKERHEVIGHYLFDIFPENVATADAAGAHSLTRSFQAVLLTKSADVMPLLKYDIQVPGSDGGEFEARFWLTTNSPLLDAGGEVAFIINRTGDVTDRVRAELERDRVLHNLQQALDDVKHLTGLIPICSWCKKVRDGEGSWQKLEEFLSERTEATLTHGMCVDCARNMAP